MRAYGSCNLAGPGDHHTPPKLPGSDQKHTIDAIGVYGMDRYPGSSKAGTFGNLHQKRAPSFWTRERVAELRELTADGLSLEQIGAVMGRHPKTVANARSRYGITKDNTR